MTPRRRIAGRQFVSALKRDGFRLMKRGKHLVFIHSDGRMVPVSYHKSGDTFPPKTLEKMIEQAGRTEEDLIRLKLIKKSKGKKIP